MPPKPSKPKNGGGASHTLEPVDIEAFTATQLSLLETELEAELSENCSLISTTSPAALQRAGLALINLCIVSQKTGLGGKTVLELGLDGAIGGGGREHGTDLPEHGIRVGDIVGVAEQPAGSAKKKEIKEMERMGSRGVVTRISRTTVSVALDGDGDGEEVDGSGSKRLWVVKLANDVTHKRMSQTITRLQKMREEEYSTFVRVMFGLSSVSTVPEDLTDENVGPEKLAWVDPELNDSQKDAIRFALASKEMALIHGPPGTGKTHTLIELILQMLKLKLRILVCGPSNISVDNIVERLASHGVPMIRLGHPARLLPAVLTHSLDVLAQTSDAAAIVRDVRREMDAKQASIRKTKSGKERKAIYGDLRELRKEYRERERRCVDNLVEGSKVVLATLHGAGGFQLKKEEFDVVIIDEASQALEAQCWVPLLSARKVVLAGDHLQLPPTIKSLNSKIKVHSQKVEGLIKGMTLETTLFDRLLRLHGPKIKRMLTTQYRMHEKIMRFPSDELYDSRLMAADFVKERLLKDLPYASVMETEDTVEPLVFWDTQGGDFPEKSEEEGVGKTAGRGLMGESKSNDMEAALVQKQVSDLVRAGVRAEDIAVITPYNAQKLSPASNLGVWMDFKDERKKFVFQPCVFVYVCAMLTITRAVIVSLVRSNAKHEVGFLGEKRRLNVAMTRPKRFLAVIGDSETLAKAGDGFLTRWMEYLEEHADLRYPDVADLMGR